MMAINYLGAIGTVTGSKYSREADVRKFMIDCGLFQGLKELRLRNRVDFLVDPINEQETVL